MIALRSVTVGVRRGVAVGVRRSVELLVISGLRQVCTGENVRENLLLTYSSEEILQDEIFS